MALIDETNMVCSFADGELAGCQKFLRLLFCDDKEVLGRRGGLVFGRKHQPMIAECLVAKRT
jgi:hypothetical protein